MALVPGKPLFTSPEATSAFFLVQSRLALEDPNMDPLRCTKQVCGGSNRNGSLFVGYHRNGGVARLEAVQEELHRRPRSAMARAFRKDMEERDRPLKELPPFRYRAEFERKPPLRPTARGRPVLQQQRRARPQSAPVCRSQDGLPRTNRGRVVVLPDDFVPFKAFRANWTGTKASLAAADAARRSTQLRP